MSLKKQPYESTKKLYSFILSLLLITPIGHAGGGGAGGEAPPESYRSAPNSYKSSYSAQENARGTVASIWQDSSESPLRPSISQGGISVHVDDLVEVTDIYSEPFSAIGQIYWELYDGRAKLMGTGFRISPCHVLTAGHCIPKGEDLADCTGNIFFSRSGRYEIDMISETDTMMLKLLGQYNEKSFTLYGTGKTDLEVHEVDWALMCLPKQETFSTHLSLSSDPSQFKTKTVSIAGYPGSADNQTGYLNGKTHGKMYGASGPIVHYAPHGYSVVGYKIDTYGGQSGSPIFVQSGSKYFAIAVHNSGFDIKDTSGKRIEVNWGALLDKKNQERIKDGMLKDFSNLKLAKPKAIKWGDQTTEEDPDRLRVYKSLGFK